jgi:hypothetical protein
MHFQKIVFKRQKNRLTDTPPQAGGLLIKGRRQKPTKILPQALASRT